MAASSGALSGALDALGVDQAQRGALELALRALVAEATSASEAKVEQLDGEVRGLRMKGKDHNIVDSRLGKPPQFAGDERNWESWYFKFRSYVLCFGGVWPALITAAESGSVEITMDVMDEEARAGARQLYMTLVFIVEDSALILVQSVVDSNGVQALRKLIQRYAPVTQGRVLATLNGILSADFGQDQAAYMDKLVTWERKVNDYERLAKEPMSDIIKRAIITERAPSEVRTHLLVNAGSLLSYESVRASIESFLAAGRRWAQEPTPMDVDVNALYWKGKGGKHGGNGKWTGKGDKGKGGWEPRRLVCHK